MLKAKHKSQKCHMVWDLPKAHNSFSCSHIFCCCGSQMFVVCHKTLCLNLFLSQFSLAYMLTKYFF